ncbi:MAG: dihydropteroate synthase [Gemmatimonadota bacterium]
MAATAAVSLEWRTARGRVPLDRPVVVGILNVTPDSFWDRGRHADVDAAVRHAGRLLEEGADVLDVGGESTRPGAAPVDVRAESARVVPVIEAVARRWPAAVLAVDTVKAEVARAALGAGAAIVNDVSGLRLDEELAAVAAAHQAGIILMHSRGDVATMARYDLAEYDGDCVPVVAAELGQAISRAHTAGIPDEAIVIDPGLGFSKRTEHSLALLAGLHRLLEPGLPVLIGPSRKRFIGDALGGAPAEDRLEGTLAACVAGLLLGARLFRVHDVAAARRALDVAEAIRRAGTG